MNNILDQIGITKEELIDRIVEKALGITADYKQTGEESWEGIPFSRVVDQKITAALGNLVQNMTGKIQVRIDEIMTAKIEELFSAPIQRTGLWGDKVGDPVSIKDMIYNEAHDYWTTKVDDTGKIPNGYQSKDPITRAVFQARKVMTEYYDKELVATVKTMAEDLKKRIPATIGEEITKTVLKHLK